MTEPAYIVYEDGIIAIGLHAEDADADARHVLQLAVKWLPPQPARTTDGTLVDMTNIMGGETGWFLLPHTLGAAVGKTLTEQKIAGLEGFQEAGFDRMVKWLVHTEHLADAMCY